MILVRKAQKNNLDSVFSQQITRSHLDIGVEEHGDDGVLEARHRHAVVAERVCASRDGRR